MLSVSESIALGGIEGDLQQPEGEEEPARASPSYSVPLISSLRQFRSQEGRSTGGAGILPEETRRAGRGVSGVRSRAEGAGGSPVMFRVEYVRRLGRNGRGLEGRGSR